MKLTKVFANRWSRGIVRRVAGFTVAMLLAPSVNSQNTTVTFQSSDKQTSLIELFTSEGCSSCPPAETWLSKLKDSSGLWKDFVPVAYHVEYWDHLGWRDPWASKQFTERQWAYARAWTPNNWRNVTVYTPCFVLDGVEWRDWSGRKNAPRSDMKAGVLTVNSTNTGRWQVTFRPAVSGERYEVHVALLSSGLNSDVKAGENRGRRLEHDFVVVSLIETAMQKQGDVFRGDCELKMKSNVNGGRLALAVWVTETGKLTPLQATGGWLQTANR